ncbi:MAG: hypothetical protein AAF234_09260 [Pseudomonadota bacterium]
MMRLAILALMIVPLLGTPVLAQKAEQQGTEDASAYRVEAFLPTLPDSFDVEGVNTDGSRYDGTAEMAYDATNETISMTWEIGNDTFSGTGSFVDGQLVVEWGDSTPVIYSITEDLNLSGTWDAGQATEELTRELLLSPPIQ